MEELNLEYIENVIAYSAVFGPDKEIVCPAIIDYVDSRTFLSQDNLVILELVKNHFKVHQSIPNIPEIKYYLKGEKTLKLFKDFIKRAKVFRKEKFDRASLLAKAEEFLRQRILTHTLSEGYAQSVTEQGLDMEAIYSQMEQAMSIHLQDDLGLSLFRDADDYVKELLNKESVISTGFNWLDKQLGGGLLTKGSALYNFCAASNIGKSNFIKSLACNISKQGKNCLVVSLEMPRYIYANRFVAELTDLGIYTLKDEHEKVLDFLQNAEGYGEIVIKDYATGSITPQMLNSYIKRVEKQNDMKFDVIFVDYPELFRKPTTYGSRYDLNVAELYIQTRALSFYNEVPIVAVAQLNREAMKGNTDPSKVFIPSMENIGNAIGIAACSDFMGFLYANDEMKAINQIGMSVGKSRFGPVNKQKLFDIDEYTLKITETSFQEVVEISSDLEGDDNEDDYLKQFMAL